MPLPKFHMPLNTSADEVWYWRSHQSYQSKSNNQHIKQEHNKYIITYYIFIMFCVSCVVCSDGSWPIILGGQNNILKIYNF